MTRIPDRSATSEEVRRYIVQALKSKQNVSPDFAEEAAQSWRLGRGSELHDAKLEYFQKLFGVEIGFCIYKNVCEDKDLAWKESSLGFACRCMLLSTHLKT